jgi:FlaA1/EpsC-like NDP-sugar epimerase
VIDTLLIRQPNVPIGLYIFAGAFSFIGFMAVRYRERLLTGAASRWLWLRTGRHGLGERLMIVGAGELGEFGGWLVRKGNLMRAFQIIGIVDDDPRKQGMRIDGIKVIGTTQDAERLVAEHDIGVIFFAISNIAAADRERIIRTLERTSARLVFIPNVVEMMRAYFAVDPIENLASWAEDAELTLRSLDDWLVEIELLISRGETAAALNHIHRLRSRFYRSEEFAELYEQALAE